jgi:hypothetical protein
MMPQTLKKVSPEFAKSYYGFMVDNLLPLQESRFIVQKKETDYSRSTTITPNPDYQPEPEVDPEPPQNGNGNGNLF